MAVGKQRSRNRSARGRDVHGVILLDKPVGLTSNQALQTVKGLFAARKAGHTGSLDPLASGMLPICLGEATKISAFLLDADKHYLVTGRLGVKTATGDAEGDVVDKRPVPALTPRKVRRVLAALQGEIEQIPPMYSAIKHKGERLYRLARRGIEVERAARQVTIHELELQDLDDGELVVEVRCSKGTYVRTLLEDIAEALGTCGHVVALRRLGVGPYAAEDMHSLPDLEDRAGQGGPEVLDAMLLPADSAVADWPSVWLNESTAFYLSRGQPVQMPELPPDGLVRLYSSGSRFLGIGEITADGRVAPRRLFVA